MNQNPSPTQMPPGDALMHFHGMLLGMFEIIGVLLSKHPEKEVLQKALPELLERLEVIKLNSSIPDPVLASARSTMRTLLGRLSSPP